MESINGFGMIVRESDRSEDELIPQETKAEITDCLGSWPKLRMFETVTPWATLIRAVSDARYPETGKFADLFQRAINGELSLPFFSHGAAFLDETHSTTDTYLVTGTLVFFTQKKMPFLPGRKHDWADWQAETNKEEAVFESQYAKISQLERLTTSLRESGKLPSGTRILYVKTDVDGNWDGDNARPFGILRDGNISWFSNVTELESALP
jgi:hypothetical protein